VTARGYALLGGGGGLMVWGWQAGWPELTALGAAALILAVVAILLTGRRPRASATLDQRTVCVMRGRPATVRVTVRLAGRRHRWLRVVEGTGKAPVTSFALPKPTSSGDVVLKVGLDTSRRGERQIGPYVLVHGDPWSIVRRVVAQTQSAVLTVQPRVHALGRSRSASLRPADTELSSRRAGEEHFHALRDYVFGDEPRMVHWRSSASAGRLVVRQQVAATADGTTVVLDVDASAYGSDDQFGTGWVAERFEEAVEVAASIAASQLTRGEQLHLVTTSRHSAVTTAAPGSVNAILDVLAVVETVAPVETTPEELPSVVRRTRCARVIVVTGTPGPRLLQATQRIRQGSTSLRVIRVGSKQRSHVAGVAVSDLQRAMELV
jgi:uncharacterized protein (DUF58 family)